MILRGKVAIITGGAMGIGLGICKVFLKLGATVIILDCSDKIKNALEELIKISKNIIGYKVDITNKDLVDKIVTAIYNRYGKIDILINNAGVFKLAKFLEFNDELRDFHFDINIKGTWNVTKAVYPYMIKHKYGKIINLSSITGVKVAGVGEVAYATTKAALIGFTKSLAIEAAKYNITVNAILPGYTITPLFKKFALNKNINITKSIIKEIILGIPIKRLGTTEEIGYLAAFLASDLANYITGAEFVIDGATSISKIKNIDV